MPRRTSACRAPGVVLACPVWLSIVALVHPGGQRTTMNAFCTSHARILHMSRGRVSLKTIGQCGKAEPLEIVATWTGQQVRALRTAWRLTIEEFAEKLGIATRAVAKWEADPSFVPALAMQQVLDSALEQVPAPVRLRFCMLAKPGSQPLLDRRMPAPSRMAVAQGAATANVGRGGSPPDAASPVDMVEAAADEADTDHLRLAAEPDSGSLTWLWEELLEIARAANRPALGTFAAARRVRHHALELADRTRRPDAMTDLHAISGQATALMASTAFDLNRWEASATLAQSAIDHASVAGHASLQAWTLGLAALLANWRDEPDAALELFHRGLRVAPRGTPRVRLRYIAARSYALLGDTASVSAVLREAERDLNDAAHHRDSLSDETGGEFGFSRSRAEACASAAWLDLGCASEAREAARRALSELTALPRSRRPLSQLSGARTDLATACLLCGDREQAEEAIQHVLELPQSARNISLAGRLARTRGALLSHSWVRDHRARQLADTIGEWLVTGPLPGPREHPLGQRP